MTSDKVAAQRATEQNKKLKHDLQGLEDAFVKMVGIGVIFVKLIYVIDHYKLR